MCAWGLRFSTEFRYNLVADPRFSGEMAGVIPSSKVGSKFGGQPGKT